MSPSKKCDPGCRCGLHKLVENPHRITRHGRVVRARGKASEYECIGRCGNQALDWAQVHGSDPLDIYAYQPMCRRCHRMYDIDSIWPPERRAVQATRCKADKPWLGARGSPN